jgi:hypothetical protein
MYQHPNILKRQPLRCFKERIAPLLCPRRLRFLCGIDGEDESMDIMIWKTLPRGKKKGVICEREKERRPNILIRRGGYIIKRCTVQTMFERLWAMCILSINVDVPGG